MKILTFVWGSLALALSLIACSNGREQSVTGIITEATMNTMMIATAQGDSLNVSTLDAERVVKDGILLGDTATVYYKEKSKNGVIMATKVVVVPVQDEGMAIWGTWVEPVPGMEKQMQGVRFEANGVASSVNMATLLYEQWKKDGETLLLSGKSIGNGQTIAFTDTLHIVKVTTDSLVLSQGEHIIRYVRQEDK